MGSSGMFDKLLYYFSRALNKLRLSSVIIAPPYEIWASNPAKKIRDRFNHDMQRNMIQTKRWEWPHEKFLKFAPFLIRQKIY